MSMDGKKFGAGIVGGLVLALLIVGSTGSVSGLFASITNAPLAENVAHAGQSTSTVAQSSSSVVTTATTTSAYALTSPAYTANPGGTNQTTANSAALVNVNPAMNETGNAAAQQAVSRLPAIAAQPALLDGIVLLPLLVAVILGALLYRASVKGRGAETEPKVE